MWFAVPGVVFKASRADYRRTLYRELEYPFLGASAGLDRQIGEQMSAPYR
jgi:hypothetical protein